uniref:Uncharacterized protein LOC114327205 n=1 Tax=Diabrotica virgifera virgifera TaxID=50390 RepID=A0A6P7FDU4_DIAVI
MYHTSQERDTISNVISENESEDLAVGDEHQNEQEGESSREQESNTQLETAESSQVSQTENRAQTVKPPTAHKSKKAKVAKSEPAESPSTTLMKYILNKNEQPTTTNPIDAFLSGISETIKTFPPLYQHMAKTKIFNIVSDIELQLLAPSPVRPHQQPSAYDGYGQPSTSHQNYNYVDMGVPPVSSAPVLQQHFPGNNSQQSSSAKYNMILL